MLATKKPYRSLKAGGDSYYLKMSTNGIIDFEDVWGGSITAFGQKMNASAPDDEDNVDPNAEQVSFKELRLVVWAALQEYHPDVSERDAGEIIDKAGGMSKAMEVAMNALNDAMPSESSEGDNENGQGDPKLAANAPATAE